MRGKADRIAEIISPSDDRWGLADYARWLQQERDELANARSLPSGSLWTDEELAQMIDSHRRSIRLWQRHLLNAGRQIAEILASVQEAEA